MSKRHDLVIIEDRIYDAENFQWAHPGGSLFVAMFGGRDGTLAFQSYHMRSLPHEVKAVPPRGDSRQEKLLRGSTRSSGASRRNSAARRPTSRRRISSVQSWVHLGPRVRLGGHALTVRRSWATRDVFGLPVRHDRFEHPARREPRY